MKKKTASSLGFIALLLIVFVAGCNSSDGGKTDQEKSGSDSASSQPKEPVTLTMLDYRGGLSDDAFFNEIIADPVKKKYPHISMKLDVETDWKKVEDLVAAHQFPDLISSGILGVHLYQELHVALNLDPLIQTHNMNLGNFEPATIDLLRKYGENKEMVGIPYSLNFPAMYYNKDIFDKFAVPYPKDGMTWDQTIDLAKKLTRLEEGIQYKGFSTVGFSRLGVTMLQDTYDFSKKKATINTDGWKKSLDVFARFMAIPGNDNKQPWPQFSKDRIVAMNVSFSKLAELETYYDQGDKFNWDLVTVPTFADKLLVVDTPMSVLMISNQTKYQDDAFKALEVITGTENQTLISRNGQSPVLQSAEVQKAFGEKLDSLKGKNVAAIFKYKHLPINIESDYGTLINKALDDAANKVIQGKADINTALREAEESANKEIAGMETK
jgi:multiple sugar transport system substrate-binding protein